MEAWFDNWSSIAQIFITGVCCFIGLVIMLRVSGKRTLTKMNAFDFIMTVTMGSTLASAISSNDITIVEGLVALGVLILMQYIIAWISARSAWFQQLIKATPSVLYYKGRYYESTLKRERITKMEVHAAMRIQGFADPSQVLMVMLETDGRLSVIAKDDDVEALGVLDVFEDDEYLI